MMAQGSRTPGMLKRLSAFHVQLREYQAYRIIQSDRRLTREEAGQMLSLREKLVGERGVLEPLVTELTGKDTIRTVGKGPEYTYNMWSAALHASFTRTSYGALQICIDAVNQALRKFEAEVESGARDRTSGTAVRRTADGVPPRAFIAHGGETPALGKLRSYLSALGVEPLIVEEQPSEGRSVGQNVDFYAPKCDCAIILATKGDIDAHEGHFLPRGNVLMEVGELQELLKGRVVYLLQSGTKFPSNVSEKVWARFSPQSMDRAFVKVATELRQMGILKAVKPHEE